MVATYDKSGSPVYQIRKSLGLSWSGLAAEMGVTIRTIAKWEQTLDWPKSKMARTFLMRLRDRAQSDAQQVA